MAFSNAIETLSSYYGFGIISYPAAVRDLIYGDSEETWFSPHGTMNIHGFVVVICYLILFFNPLLMILHRARLAGTTDSSR